MKNLIKKEILNDQIQDFKQQNYLVLRQYIEPSVIAMFQTYSMMQRFNNYYLDDPTTKSKWRYSDVFGESLLLHLQPLMEELTQRPLFPTNSVLRIYQKGGILKKHVDRATCEYSITLTIGYEAKELYSIWVESNGKNIEIALDAGDLLVYKGCDVPHWREEFNGRNWTQLFLHYVDAEGENARYKYDGRLSVGINQGRVLTGVQVK